MDPVRVCPSCGAGNDAGATLCTRCQAAMAAPLPASAAGPSEPAPPQPAFAKPDGAQPGKAIRVELPQQKLPAPETPAEEQPGGVPPQTGIVIGLTVVLAALVAALPTVVFFVLACVLAVLHREMAHPDRSLEDYARIVPERVEQAFHKLSHPDGRFILLIFLLAVAVYLAHPIVFGLAGAAALITAFYLLDWLDRPADSALAWFSTHEEAWAARLRRWLTPQTARVMAILTLFPSLWYLGGFLLPARLARWHYLRPGLAGGVVLVLLGLSVLGRGRSARGTPDQARRAACHTFLISAIGLILAVGSISILMAMRMRIPFMTEQLEWNGVWLALVPVAVLGAWCQSYLRRAGTSAAAEAATWPLSALAAVIMVGTGFLLARALELQGRGWETPGSAGLFAVMLAGWLAATRLLVGAARSEPGGPIPEWTLVFVAAMTILLVVFFLVHFGGAWGLALSIPPAIRVWQVAAQLHRKQRVQPEGPERVAAGEAGAAANQQGTGTTEGPNNP